MVLAIYQIILHLNKITECLKMTTFKIVFTFDVFLNTETTMHCKVTCILYKKQAYFSQLFCLQVRSVTPWQLHDRKSNWERSTIEKTTCKLGENSSFSLLLLLLFLWIKTGIRDFLQDKSFVLTAALGLEFSGSNDIVLILPLY